LRFWDINPTHGNTKTQPNKKMRTKTLLVAVAALALSLATSQAQVYSANVVGYASVPLQSSVTYLLTCPFTVGVSNGANEVFNPPLPDFSQLNIWNGGGYDTYFSDTGSTSGWDDVNQNPIPNAPILQVGIGFFLVPSANVTNTFVGQVAVNIGTTNSVVLNNSVTYLLSCAVPYSGAITNGGPSGGGPALSSDNGLPDFSQLNIWNGGGYDTYFSDSTSPSLWDDVNQNPIGTPPSISVAQGFFLIPSATFTWKVGLTP